MSTCSACGETVASGCSHCPACGTTVGVDPGDTSQEFQALGTVKLKKAKRSKTLSGRPIEVATESGSLPSVKATDSSACHAAGSPSGSLPGVKPPSTSSGGASHAPLSSLRAPAAGAGGGNGVALPGFEATNVPEQMPFAGHEALDGSDGVPELAFEPSSGGNGTSGGTHTAAPGVGSDDGPIVGAPPLPVPVPPILTLRALPLGQGVVDGVRYAWRAPGRRRQQRDVLQQITNQLAKDKRTEQEVVAALGRAARMRQLTPPSCHDLVAASAQTEQGVAADQEKSVQQAEEARQADAAFQAASLKGQAQLDSLEQKLATAEAQAATTDQEVAQAEAKVAQLEAQEKEFSAAAGSGGKDATEQIRLYEGAKAQRKIAEMELKGLRDRQRAGQRPLNRLRGDIERVRGEVTKAQQRLDAAERGAEAAVLSQQRRTEMTRRNVAQFDEQIGRAVLALPKAPDSLKQLWASADVARRRVERGEDALRDQQGELDQYDSRRARIGLWLLVGVVLFSLAVLVAGGEIIRGLSGGEG